MKIFVTNVPSFYKIKLFNEINKREKIIVLFTGKKDFNDRNQDFFSEEIQFEHYYFSGKNKITELRNFLKSHEYDELIIAGWDSRENWWCAFHSPRKKNSVVVESTILESKIKGYKGLLKRIFLCRVSKAYPSGTLHKDLLLALGFKGQINITGGVGLMNRIAQPVFQPRTSVKNFLYVGRLVEVKNLEILIQAFNEMPDLRLTIVGFGIQESLLKSIAKDNIIFMGAVNNRDLGVWYQNSDVFVLASKSETWGLVVEEALNNGCPILLSDKIGCKEDLLTSETGLSFVFNDKEDLKLKVRKMCDIDFYNSLRLGVSKLNFEQREKNQIEAFL